MTTEAAARLYEAQHLVEMEGKGYAIFNPYNKPVAELPVIYGFNNGGNKGWYSAVALSQDGFQLGGHICSSEGYMPHDLGILAGTRPDRHKEEYQNHYPEGYRMDFVGYNEIKNHVGLNKAIERANARCE